ncbi:TPA: putative toxin-antitoxin system toxin component, PIN family [Candidatus Woesearchaeota archaeon]|nr:putative toxin-antitoxin system toxin component, PIN family [Candidatus Woesearchaeota archaeon]HIH39457.1 putative toxin-antitoxin system toxin component, PIN family [Candidatus Woesearchaeota archaeon]
MRWQHIEKRNMRVVLDTNILVSAAICDGSQAEIIRKAHDGVIKLVISSEIINELSKVLSRPKFKFSREQIESYVSHLVEAAEIVEPDIELNIIKEDPSDDRILECAVFGDVDYIVSGDSHILNLKEIKNIPIITSRKFLEVIK